VHFVGLFFVFIIENARPPPPKKKTTSLANLSIIYRTFRFLFQISCCISRM